MKILVDTSVWSVALRKSESRSPAAIQLRRLIEDGEQIMMLGIILQEILQGVREQPQFDRLRKFLQAFPVIPLKEDDYVRAAGLFRECRKRGVVAGTVDFLIAAASLQYGCALLTADQDFTRIAACCPLKLMGVGTT